MTCDTLQTSLSAYLDGDLDASSCASIERHAARCPDCATIIAEFRAATGLCRTAADAPLPDEVRRLALERVRALLRKD